MKEYTFYGEPINNDAMGELTEDITEVFEDLDPDVKGDFLEGMHQRITTIIEDMEEDVENLEKEYTTILSKKPDSENLYKSVLKRNHESERLLKIYESIEEQKGILFDLTRDLEDLSADLSP